MGPASVGYGIRIRSASDIMIAGIPVRELYDIIGEGKDRESRCQDESDQTDQIFLLPEYRQLKPRFWCKGLL